MAPLGPEDTAVGVDRGLTRQEIRTKRNVAGARLTRVVARIAVGMRIKECGAAETDAAGAIEGDVAAVDARSVDDAADDDRAAVSRQVNGPGVEGLSGIEDDISSPRARGKTTCEAIGADAIVKRHEIDGTLGVNGEGSALIARTAVPVK